MTWREIGEALRMVDLWDALAVGALAVFGPLYVRAARRERRKVRRGRE